MRLWNAFDSNLVEKKWETDDCPIIICYSLHKNLTMGDFLRFHIFRISPCFCFSLFKLWMKKEGVGADLWISCVLVTNLSRRISSFLPSSHLKRGEIEEAINSKSLHFSQLVWPDWECNTCSLKGQMSHNSSFTA